MNEKNDFIKKKICGEKKLLDKITIQSRKHLTRKHKKAIEEIKAIIDKYDLFRISYTASDIGEVLDARREARAKRTNLNKM